MKHRSIRLSPVHGLFVCAPLFAAGTAQALPKTAVAPPQTSAAAAVATDGPLVDADVLRDAKLYASIELDRDGADAEALASLHELTFAADTGRLLQAVVASGGIAGIDRDLRVLDLASMRWSHEHGHFATDLTRAEFRALPILDDDSLERSSARRRAADGAPVGVSAMTESLAMASLDDEPVRAGARGGEWGRMVGLRVDWEARRVAYAIVEVGGLAGIGATRHPVPWSALDIDWVTDEQERTRRASVPMTAAELEAAPALDAASGRTLASTKFRRALAIFWGTEPTDGEPLDSAVSLGGRRVDQ